MELYHVLNRGVDKRDICIDDRDRFRFVYGLTVFNTTKHVEVYKPSKDWITDFNSWEKGLTRSLLQRERLVDIHGWCLMNNHFHMLISELKEGGLTTFLRKQNVGYAKYFNERHERSGTLFQGRTKKVLIDSDAHFLHILNYIHFNPLDYVDGAHEWRDGQIGSTRSAIAQLQRYRWSSYADYCGQPNFPYLLTTELFKDIFKDYKKRAANYLRELEIDQIEPFLIR